MYKLSNEPTSTHILLTNYIQPNSAVLDVGCASGYLGEMLVKEKKCEVWGIEPNADSFKEARDKGYKMIINKKIEEALGGLQGEQFNYILIGDVLEHLENPESILLLLNKFLRNNGRLIVSLPNVAHYSTRLGLLFGNWDMAETGILDKTHLHFYTLKSAKELLKNSGWKIVDFRPRGDLERWFRKFGLEWVGKKILFFRPTFFAVQLIFVAEK